MLTCSHCGATYQRKINKTNGLPQKNQRDVCSDRCWHAKHREQNREQLNARSREIYKPKPRAERAKKYHCCELCGNESMKVMDKRDANRFCSIDCVMDAKRKVARERDLLFRIGRHYHDRLAREASARIAAGRALAKAIKRLSVDRARSVSVCLCCGERIQYVGNGRPPVYCSKSCAAKSTNQKEYRRAVRRNRKAAKKKRLPCWFGELDHMVWREAAHLVRERTAATGIEWHADHMIPMKAKEASGLHVWNNCQVIPAELNALKSNNMLLTSPLEWLELL